MSKKLIWIFLVIFTFGTPRNLKNVLGANLLWFGSLCTVIGPLLCVLFLWTKSVQINWFINWNIRRKLVKFDILRMGFTIRLSCWFVTKSKQSSSDIDRVCLTRSFLPVYSAAQPHVDDNSIEVDYNPQTSLSCKLGGGHACTCKC